jgi:hypothetical protein
MVTVRRVTRRTSGPKIEEETEGWKFQILQPSSTVIGTAKLVRMDRLTCKKLDMSDHFLSKKRKGNVGDIGSELHERIILKAAISSV